MKLARQLFFPVVAVALGLVFWWKGLGIHRPGAIALTAAFIAASMVFDRWKRFILIMGTALAAFLIFQRYGLTYGIDLAGGGELRYSFDTADFEEQIRQLRDQETGVKAERDRKLADIDRRLVAETDETERARRQSERNRVVEEAERKLSDIAKAIAAAQARMNTHTGNAVDIIRKRLDPTGIKEMTVAALGEDEIIVRIPFRAPEGVDHATAEREFSRDIERIKDLIEEQGVLYFYIVEKDGELLEEAKKALDQLKPVPDGVILVVPHKEFLKKGQEAHAQGLDLRKLGVIQEAEREKAKDVSAPMLLRAKPEADGSIIQYATASMGDEGYQVNMVFTPAGSHIFEKLTRANVGKNMAIVLDGVMQSAPVIRETISGSGRISGSFSPKKASLLAEVLTAGSLPLKVKFQSSVIIGPGQGGDDIVKGIYSVVGAGALVLVFMAVYYLGGGLVADLALLLNLVYIVGAMALFNATLTLPGIAGILLTVGMAVDANILIFERIREEKARGRVLRLAVQAGYDRAFVTIMDAQITTLITAIILYYVGTGPVKGFAVTLMMGIVASLFTSLYVTRLVIEFLVAKGIFKEMKMLRVIGETALPFVRMRLLAFILSAAVIGVGIWGFVTHDRKYGIDFAGGTRLLVAFAEEKGTADVRGWWNASLEAVAATVDPEVKRSVLDAVSQTRINAFESVTYGRSKKFSIMTPLVQEGGEGGGDLIEAVRGQFTRTAQALADPPFLSTESIGTAVSKELRTQAAQAVLFSLVAIFLYIIARFEFNVAFGAGAVAALAHDVAITVGAIVLLDKLNVADLKINIETVAALLAIVGYSLNDTIVVYDRIRENRRAHRSTPWPKLVNLSINQTLSRTLLTSATTFFAVGVLFLAGGGNIHGFALALMLGVMVGTYSSIFVASPLVVEWMKRRAESD